METISFPEREVRRRVNGLLSKFPHKKMQEWVKSQKNHAALREMKKEMFDFYFLMGDLSVEGVAERQRQWSVLQKKYPSEIIELLFLLGSRGRHLYHQATAGDRYAVMVLLSLTEVALNEA
ncbi:TPA: hypothetical protein H2S96_004289 [Salmonella enterica]|uniref:hypothetical protein n=1 Tax=Salmonella enterica TaxID=28901 RepID=UPI0019C35AB8|nr:hypothetical protein [Salmonella enterica]MDL2989158.1 hypothetical protein [Salmonella enterica]HAK6771616.1 hypothetical protein [Salmonella enterica]HAK6818099.1 hypothetical protein [Salmonella enterica]